MDTKLLLIEGIPGSGKSTISKRIHAYLEEKGIRSQLFNEGDLHPADLAWHACVPAGEFADLLAKHPGDREAVMRQTTMEEDYAIVAYTHIDTDNQELRRLLETYEVYDNRVPFERFGELHLQRWERFARSAAAEVGITLFECAFLQNHINELLLFQLADESAILAYMSRLLTTVLALNPVLLYLSQPDVRGTIEKVGDVRVNAQGEKEWLNACIAYIERSPFGKNRGLRGIEGSIAYFEQRKASELALLSKLPLTSYVVKNAERNWEKVWDEIRGILDRAI